MIVTNNQVLITITAEDGTSVSYTLFLNIILAVTAEEIPKRTAADVRDSYVLFNIEANKNLSNYHLAVKEKGKTAPTTTEMTKGALKRHLSTNSINVLIAQRLNAPMITFAKTHFTNSSHTILGQGMTSHFNNGSGLIFDSKDVNNVWTPATGTNAWVAESVLRPNTEYSIYGMKDRGSQVESLLTFNTDSPAYPSAQTNDDASLIDSTLEEGYIDISLNADEHYIFPLQSSQLKKDLERNYYYYSGQSAGNIAHIIDSWEIFGVSDSGYRYQLYMYRSETTEEEMLFNTYVLINTGKMVLHEINNNNPIKFGKIFIFFDLRKTPLISYSHLKIQN